MMKFKFFLISSFFIGLVILTGWQLDQVWQGLRVGAATPDFPYNANPTTVSFSRDGRVAMFYKGLVGGAKVRLSSGDQEQVIYPSGGGERLVTNISVKAGESVRVEVYYNSSQKALGWIAPGSDNVCGSGLPGPPRARRPFARVNIGSFISSAESYGQPLESVECWGDWMEWQGDFDFNDFFIIFSYGEGGPEPSPTPEPGKARWIIRKFNDKNRNGVWDGDEGATGERFRFDWRENDGSWFRLETSAMNGWSQATEEGLGTKIDVKEVGEVGWINTTGSSQVKTLDEAKTYYFDFGNVQEPDYVETEPPEETPETGICTRC